MRKKLHHLRNDYAAGALIEEHVGKHPVAQFQKWFDDLLKSSYKEPTAVILATSTRSGKPSARTVLMKEFSKDGFVFFTNYKSRKGQELQQNPRAALLFYWDVLERQVRIEGTVKKTDAKISDEYFDSRPRQSRISAVASPQSKTVKNRFVLEEKVMELEEKFSGKEKIPRPENWGGYILKPTYFEFWQGRENRLHDRIIYTLSKGKWKVNRLAP